MKKKLLFVMLFVLFVPCFVFAEDVDTDTIMKKLAPDLENAIFKAKKPKDDFEADSIANGYVGKVLVKEVNNDYNLYTYCKEPYTTCTIDFTSEDYESAGGPMSVFYHNYLYGSVDGGVYLKRVIYIPEDTANNTQAYIDAAQKRINDYLGNSSVTVTYGGTLTELNNAFKDAETANRIANGEVEGVDFTRDELPLAEDEEVLVEGNDGNYYLIKIENRTYKSYIAKASNEKLKEPTYSAININSKIEVSSEDSSIPLDAAVIVNDVNNNEIKNKVGTENYKAYDITIHSDAKGLDVKLLENGKFLVRIPVPDELKEEENLTVYYIPTEGAKEEYKVSPKTIDGKLYVEFETTHFSVYVLVQKKEEMPEPKFNVTYIFNGGSRQGEIEYVDEMYSIGLDITKENFVDEFGVTPPNGKELDAIEINGVRTELGNEYILNKDTVFKYLWKSIDGEKELTSKDENQSLETPLSNNINNPKTGDNIMIYISVLCLSVIIFIAIGICSKKKLFNKNKSRK